MSNYIFKWALTTNCTYSCPFCIQHDSETFSNKNLYSKVLSFFYELSKLDDTESIRIILFGGECTIHPDFLDIVNFLITIPKVKLSIFTNLSSDIQLYQHFCDITSSKLLDFLITYHEEFVDINEFKNKLNVLLNTYDVEFCLFCMVGKYHKTENELLNIFKNFLKYSSFKLLFAPIVGDNYKINNDGKNNTNNVYRLINNKNIRYNKYCTNYYEIESFINSKCILFPCQMVQTNWKIDIPISKNPAKTFYVLKQLKIKCNQTQCCGNMTKIQLKNNTLD